MEALNRALVNVKTQNLGLKIPHLGGFRGKVKIFSIHNLLSRKFAASLSVRKLQLPVPPPTILTHDADVLTRC